MSIYIFTTALLFCIGFAVILVFGGNFHSLAPEPYSGAYFICLHNPQNENISSNRTLDLQTSFMKEKVCCKWRPLGL